MIWLYISVISGWTKYKTKFSGAGLSVLKFEYSVLLLKNWKTVQLKFSDINAYLDEIEQKKTLKNWLYTEEVNESIMDIKNTIIDALREENLKLQNKVKKIEHQLLELHQKSNNLDQ